MASVLGTVAGAVGSGLEDAKAFDVEELAGLPADSRPGAGDGDRKDDSSG